MKKILFLIAGGVLYVGAFVVIGLLYYLMPAGSTFPVILIVLPAIPMLWLGSICLRNGNAPKALLLQWKK